MSKVIECPNCEGSGVITSNPSSHPAWETDTECPDCNGTGEIEAPSEAPNVDDYGHAARSLDNPWNE